MIITDIPFNRFVGLNDADDKTKGIFQLDENAEYGNHIGTVHASAQFALAEATSGAYMMCRFGKELSSGVIPVVRNVSLKYTAPAKGKLYSQAAVTEEQAAEFLNSLSEQGRAALPVTVNIVDTHDVVTMTANFEWLVKKIG